MNRINFANDNMQDKLRQISDQHLRHNLKKWVRKVTLDNLNEISDF